MPVNETERLIFEAEWYDSIADIVKKFYLHFFPSDNTVELFDIKNKRTFLRRTKYEGFGREDFYVGAVVTICSRSMKITEITDNSTRHRVNKTLQKSFAIIKPNAIVKMGEILKVIAGQNIHVGNIKMCLLEDIDVEKVFRDPEILEKMKNDLTAGPVVLLMLLGEDAVNRLQEMTEMTETTETSSENLPLPLKVVFNDGFYVAPNTTAAENALSYFFTTSKSSEKRKFKNSATLKKCTCCVIKPHAVLSKLTGDIIYEIQKSGYSISAIQQFHVDPVNAEEFLEIYKGVLADYNAMVAELQSGPCIAMEITHKDGNVNVPVEFRKLCGPMDPEIGREVRPNTLRAKFGKSKVQNAIHCSDLPEDGLLEVEYFFQILDD